MHECVSTIAAADSDAKELDRQRILLCITKAEIETIQRETCGRLFQSVSLLAFQHALACITVHSAPLSVKSASSRASAWIQGPY